jgi:hypothetical protein
MSDMMKSTVITAIATLVSALAAVAVTLHFDRSFTIRDLQRSTFERIAGWRFKMAPKQLKCNGDEFFAALNEAEVVFHDNAEVRIALDGIRAQGPNNDVYLATALREMMIVLKIDPPLREGALLHPIGPTDERC